MPFSVSPIFIILALVFSLTIIICFISLFECKTYEICRFAIKSGKIKSKAKIVFISDLHDKVYGTDNDCLIKDILDSNPDYILLGGDFINYSALNRLKHRVEYKNATRFFANLTKNTKDSSKISNVKRIIFSFGNHEMRLKDGVNDSNINTIYNDLINVLKSCEIEILDNNKYSLSNDMSISGLSLYKGYYYNIFKKSKNHRHIEKKLLDEYFGKLDTNIFNIVSFHKPDYAKDLIDYGFDLVLSGHNHGGLIRLPIIGSVFSPDFKLFPKYDSGLYEINGKHLLVSAGLGEHFIRIRVNNRPKIYVIDIL